MYLRLPFTLLATITCITPALTQKPTLQEVSQSPTKKVKLPHEADTLKQGWATFLLISSSYQQTLLKNWLLGGDEQAIGRLQIDFYPVLRFGRFKWDQAFLLRTGFQRKNSTSWQKVEDQLEIIQVANILFGKTRKWSWTAIAHLRTQLFPAFDEETGELKSGFMSPGWLTTSAGMSINLPKWQIQLFWSPIAGKVTYVLDPYLSQQGAYGVDTGKAIASELGTYLMFQLRKALWDNRTAIAVRLDLFQSYENNFLTYPDFNAELTYTLKLWKIIGFTAYLRLFYDNNITLETGTAPLQIQLFYGLNIQIVWKKIQTHTTSR